MKVNRFKLFFIRDTFIANERSFLFVYKRVGIKHQLLKFHHSWQGIFGLTKSCRDQLEQSQ